MKEKTPKSTINFVLPVSEKHSIISQFKNEGLSLSNGMRKLVKEKLNTYQGTEGVVTNAGNSTSQ